MEKVSCLRLNEKKKKSIQIGKTDHMIFKYLFIYLVIGIRIKRKKISHMFSRMMICIGRMGYTSPQQINSHLYTSDVAE
jgi:hypothetical protein